MGALEIIRAICLLVWLVVLILCCARWFIKTKAIDDEEISGRGDNGGDDRHDL